jgi:hypothetical protein
MPLKRIVTRTSLGIWQTALERKETKMRGPIRVGAP